MTTAVLGRVLFFLGDWSEGRAYLDRGAETLSPLGIGQYDAQVLSARGAYAFGEGDWDDAARCLEQVRVRTEWKGDLRLRCEAQILLAEHDLDAGRAEEARLRVESFLSRPELLEIHAIPALPYLALAYLNLGDTARAGDIMRDTLARSRTAEWVPVLADVLRVHGIVQAASGQLQAAEDAFTEAVALARRLPYPWLEGRTLLAHGEALMRLGEIGRARDLLDEAGAIFRRLGARKDLERATAALSVV